jgi:hypothetical protein
VAFSLCGWSETKPAWGQVPQSAEHDGLIALSMSVGDGLQQITVIDPETRVMCVYHVQQSSGKIELKSARNVRWDLQLDRFNATEPLPLEIRSLVEQR